MNEAKIKNRPKRFCCCLKLELESFIFRFPRARMFSHLKVDTFHQLGLIII